MEVCLACARLEWNDELKACPDCGGRLWHPQDVAGETGCEDAHRAADMVRRGLKPWLPMATNPCQPIALPRTASQSQAAA